jgi:hypothetical protein
MTNCTCSARLRPHPRMPGPCDEAERKLAELRDRTLRRGLLDRMAQAERDGDVYRRD